jgi:hypothetical protein
MALQLKITLNHTNPPIWRRVLVPADITFFDLHHILQITMGWKHSHLFDFKFGNYIIGYLDEDAPEDLADANEVTLDTLLTKPGLKFKYFYDFGDGWEHTIEVEKITDEVQEYPVCVEGEMNCPPEDCGGIPGFENLLSILNDKGHPEYEEMREWAGRYNPKKFNMAKINRELPKYKNYMKHWKK